MRRLTGHTEPARVVVAHGLSIAERLHNWVRLQDLLFDTTVIARRTRDRREERQDLLRCLGLARARLAGHDHRLAAKITCHRLAAKITGHRCGCQDYTSSMWLPRSLEPELEIYEDLHIYSSSAASAG